MQRNAPVVARPLYSVPGSSSIGRPKGEPVALLATPGFYWAEVLWRKRLPPTTHCFSAVGQLRFLIFHDFSPTTDFSGGALALVNSMWFCPLEVCHAHSRCSTPVRLGLP